MPQLTACPSCAEHLDPGDRFCGNCGAALTEGPPAPGDAESAAGAGSGPGAPRAEAAGGAPTGSYQLAPPAPIQATVPVSSSAAERSPVPPPAPRAGAVDPRQELLAVLDEDAETEPQPVVPREVGDCQAAGLERDHVERVLPCVAAISDKGLRHQRNEDAFAVAEAERPDGSRAVIAVVCDGVSSATRPDEASAIASQAGGARLANDMADGADPRTAMHEALLVAAAAVNGLTSPEAAEDPHFNAPACTCVSAVLCGDILTVGWIGDSRAYWIPDAGEPSRLTLDDSWAARMVEAGLMTEADAYADPRAHAITGWLGADVEELDPHTASFQLDGPGVVVVCTDGLWNYVESAAELSAVVPDDARTDPLGAARSLVKVALDSGGHDNVTVALVPYPLADGGPREAGGGGA